MKLTVASIALIYICLFHLASPDNAQPGSLDPSFGSGGMFITSPPLANDPNFASGAKDMVFQSDGKIVMLANAGNVPQTFRNVLVRFNPDGSLDAGFGNGGFAYLAWTAPGTGIGISMELQSINGQEYFVVVGTNATAGSIRCQRYTSTGALDATFGTGGVTSLNISGASIAVQADGKILLGGNPVARLNADGTPDATYGPSGISPTNAGISIAKLKVMADGKVLAVGSAPGTKVKGVTYTDFAIARLNPNGSVDTAFGTRGKTVIDFQGKSELGCDVAIDTAGRIIASGEAQMTIGAVTSNDAALVRLSPTGLLDTTFGTNGKTTLNFGTGQDIYNSLSVQGDGKILVTGEARLPGMGNRADIVTARYNTNGTLDTSFDSDGWTLKDFYGEYDYAQKGRVQIDASCSCEKYVVVGGATIQSGSSKRDIIGLRYML